MFYMKLLLKQFCIMFNNRKIYIALTLRTCIALEIFFHEEIHNGKLHFSCSDDSPKLCTSLLIYEETTDNESNRKVVRKPNNCDIFTPFALFDQPLNYNLI